MLTVGDICERLTDHAESLAATYLPNGRKSGGYWMFSGIADSGRSESAYLHLSGPKVGKWFDMGHAHPGEDKGDLLDLIRLKDGRARGEVSEAVRIAKSILGLSDVFDGRVRELTPAEKASRAAEARARAEAREAASAAQFELKAKRAKKLFLGAQAIVGTPAEAYLRGRELAATDGEWPGSLRFHAEVWNSELSVKMPAMIACILRADGQQIGAHRTYLEKVRGTWSKCVQVRKAKMVIGNQKAGFIPINSGSSGKSMRHMAAGEPVYVTEGIEDALVVRLMKPEARIVAAINLTNLGDMVLPEAATRLVICGDRDPAQEERDKLEVAIAKQQARGLQVQLVMPPIGLKDMNDWWRALKRQDGRLAVRGAA